MFDLHSFIGSVAMTFMALLPPVNPLGTVVIIDPYLNSLSISQRKRASLKIAIYSFFVCLFTTFVGGALFKVFGITLPAVQIAGGILISRMGYEVLHNDNSEKSSKGALNDPEKNWDQVQTSLFYPLAFPMTTGAGTIAVILTLSADSFDPISFQHLQNQVGIVIGSLLMCISVYFSYHYAPLILRKLGDRGQIILNRFSGFLTLCVGIQVLINGISEAIKQFR